MNIRPIGERATASAEAEVAHPARCRVVERTFGWLKGWRALHKGCNSLALVQWACALIVFRRIQRVIDAVRAASEPTLTCALAMPDIL